MPRLFFGLEPPEPLKRRLLVVQRPVHGARWQTRDQLHITLLFLGQVPDEQVAQVRAAGQGLPVAPFDLSVEGLGVFGRPEQPRNLWAGVAPEAPLQALHAELGARLQSVGFPAEQRAFRPHLTLARFRRQAGSVEALLAEHQQAAFGEFPVAELALLESTQGRGGSIYTEVERFQLNSGPVPSTPQARR